MSDKMDSERIITRDRQSLRMASLLWWLALALSIAALIGLYAILQH